MAVTKRRPRLTVEVLVRGTALREYKDEDVPDTNDTVNRYIEAASGAEFIIHSRLTPPWPSTSLRVDVYLDGKYATGCYMLQESFDGKNSEIDIKGVQATVRNQWFLEKFCFSEISIRTSSKYSAKSLPSNLNDVGVITVRAYNVTNIHPYSQSLQRQDIARLDGIHEKALKGRTLTHQSTLKAPEPIVSRYVLGCNRFDYEDCVFNFRYRSRAALKSLLLIPRSPSPESRKNPKIGPAEARETRKSRGHTKSCKENSPRVKQENVKRERANSDPGIDEDYHDEVFFVSAKRARFHGNVTINDDGVETIDLT